MPKPIKAGHSQFQLMDRIVELSHSKTWDEARWEWQVNAVYQKEHGEPSGTCLCGHHPIREICVIYNPFTGRFAEVGNVCVNKFLVIPTDTLFKAMARIHEDITAALNSDTVRFAFDNQWINKWEYEFYLDTWRKRKLSKRQMNKRISLNERIKFAMKLQSMWKERDYKHQKHFERELLKVGQSEGLDGNGRCNP